MNKVYLLWIAFLLAFSLLMFGCGWQMPQPNTDELVVHTARMEGGRYLYILSSSTNNGDLKVRNENFYIYTTNVFQVGQRLFLSPTRP